MPRGLEILEVMAEPLRITEMNSNVHGSQQLPKAL